MKTSELKTICESLIDTFNDAGKISVDLFKQGLKIEIIRGDVTRAFNSVPWSL